LIYFIVNNDFHVEYVLSLIEKHKYKNISIIRIPYSLKKTCTEISNNVITINTPFRTKNKFWNPINFYNIKKYINKNIKIQKDDIFIFFTEYDPINQYIIYKAKRNKAKTILVEEGIATYYTFLNSHKYELNFLEFIKLKYLQYIVGFHYFNYIKIGDKLFAQMNDKYIDNILLCLDININRNIKRIKIEFPSKKIDNLNNDRAVFLNQPLYESYLTEEEYFLTINKLISIISKRHNEIYFKFHPRDNEIIKKNLYSIINQDNVHFIDEISINDFILLHKPKYAYGVFSDALLKLYYQGLTVTFMYKYIKNMNNHPVLKGVETMINIVNEIKLRVED